MCDGMRGWAKLRSHGRWLGLGLLLVVAASGRAQAPGDPAAKTYTNKKSFYLPIKLDERSRGNLREVLLFVKAGAGEWRQQDSVPPTEQGFKYKVTQDGEYWFGVVLVDQQGRKNPPDVSREPPALMVVVDTQPPTVEFQPAPLPGGRTGLRLTVQDANPDPRATTVTCLMPDQSWRDLKPADNNPNVYALTGAEAPNGSVRVVAADRAGNITRREFSLRELIGNGKHDAGVQQAGGVATPIPEIQTQRTGYQQPEPAQPVIVTPSTNSGNVTPPSPPAPLNPPPVQPEPVQAAPGAARGRPVAEHHAGVH